MLSFSLNEGKKGIQLVKQYASCCTVRSVYYQLWDSSIYKLKLNMLVWSMACKWNIIFLLLRKPNDKTYWNNLETRLDILWCNIQILQYYGFVYILVLWHWLTASTLGHTNFPEMIVNICHCGFMNFSYPCRNLTLPYKIYICNKFHHSINIYGTWHT